MRNLIAKRGMKNLIAKRGMRYYNQYIPDHTFLHTRYRLMEFYWLLGNIQWG